MGLHLIKEHDQVHTCPHCRTETKKHSFDSEFHHDMHYKTMSCPKCDEKLWINVDFIGTGHDEWTHKKRRFNELRTSEERVAFRKLNHWI